MIRKRSKHIVSTTGAAVSTLLLVACSALLNLQDEYQLASDAASDGTANDGQPAGDASRDAQFSDATVDASSIEAPRLISPLTTATVSTQTPTITWALPAGVEGGHVEICADRACATVQTTFDIPGTSGNPSSTLNPGVHFVRVAGRVGSTIGNTTSATWEFFVPHSPHTTRQTSYGGFPDFNGDGLPEIYAAGGGQLALVLFPGTKTGPQQADQLELTNSVSPSDNSPQPTFGDIDGDGFTDLVVGNITTEPFPQDGVNQISIYRGGPAGIAASSTPAWVIHVPANLADGGTNLSLFAFTVKVAGDVNGDGYADILAASILMDASTAYEFGPTFVFFGHANGPSTKPDAQLDGNPSDAFPYYLQPAGAIGDVNGDGYDDVLCTTEAGYGTWLFLGSATGPSDATRYRITPPATAASGGFGTVLTGTGDIDGDGLPDFAIGAEAASVPTDGGQGPGQLYVFKGDTDLAQLVVADWTLNGPDGPGSLFGAGGAIAGDLNGDGFDDIEVGAAAVGNYAGRGYYYRGGPSGVSDGEGVVTLTEPGANPINRFGTGAQAGDLNGDGIADLIVSQLEGSPLFIYYGSLGVGINDSSLTSDAGTTSVTVPISQVYIFSSRDVPATRPGG